MERLGVVMPRWDRRGLEPTDGVRVGVGEAGDTREGATGRLGLTRRPGITCTGAIGLETDREGAVTLGGVVTLEREVVRDGGRAVVAGMRDGVELEEEPRSTVMPPRSGTARVGAKVRLALRDGVRRGVDVVVSCRRVGAMEREGVRLEVLRGLLIDPTEERVGARTEPELPDPDRTGAALKVRVLGVPGLGASQEAVRLVA
jgi:hypothetical protein